MLPPRILALLVILLAVQGEFVPFCHVLNPRSRLGDVDNVTSFISLPNAFGLFPLPSLAFRDRIIRDPTVTRARVRGSIISFLLKTEIDIRSF